MKDTCTKREYIRVLVADSNKTQSEVMCSALRRQPGIKISSCRAELSDCMQALQSAPADVVLLGDGSPDHDHLVDTIRVLHASYPRAGLVLLLDRYDRNLVVDAMRAGARGLFDRARQPFKALCRCISVIHEGQFWANTEQISYVIDAVGSTLPGHVVNAKGERLLTAREDQIVSLVAEGMGNRDIADQLGIKENTVKKSLMRIYDKLGMSNRVELVLYALTHRGIEQAVTSATPLAVAKPLTVDATEVSQQHLLVDTLKVN